MVMVLSNSQICDYILAILIYFLGTLRVMINIYGFLAKKYNACLDTWSQLRVIYILFLYAIS